MTDHVLDDVLGRVQAVIVAVDDLLPSSDLTSAWELVDAGEPGVALENLCTELHEEAAFPDDDVHRADQPGGYPHEDGPGSTTPGTPQDLLN